jgi:hypothetical protein
VPLGAPGEIVFSGVCVGRGYVNDPERTRKAFTADPLRVGERLYRSGDYGRWRPDGKLEFLGRQDAQVKIRGFRIEIGDIENSLLRVPGVRMGAVVVTEREGGSKQLVAFFSGQERVDVTKVRDSLARALPEYMVPSVFHWQATLPLTSNGKIDKKILRKRATELEDETGSFEAPKTPTEQKLAVAWAKVLGVSSAIIGRHDHFFDRGGTSLSSVKLVIALGTKVSLKDIARHPVLAELAEVLDGRIDAPRFEHVGATYRHDFDVANRYLADILDNPADAKLSVPVSVVGAADDPVTVELSHRHRDWQVAAGQVDPHMLDEGGHYFPRIRPPEVASIDTERLVSSV